MATGGSGRRTENEQKPGKPGAGRHSTPTHGPALTDALDDPLGSLPRSDAAYGSLKISSDGSFSCQARDASNAPVPDTTITISMSGPESVTLTSGPSHAQGIADVTWKHQRPARQRAGTATSSYSTTTSGVSVSGFPRDGVGTGFSLH